MERYLDDILRCCETWLTTVQFSQDVWGSSMMNIRKKKRIPSRQSIGTIADYIYIISESTGDIKCLLNMVDKSLGFPELIC